MWKHVTKQMKRAEANFDGDDGEAVIANDSDSSSGEESNTTEKQLSSNSSALPENLLSEINGSTSQTTSERQVRFTALKNSLQNPLRPKNGAGKPPTLDAGNFSCILCSRNGQAAIYEGLGPEEHLKTGRHTRNKKRFLKVLINRRIVLPETPEEVLTICDLIQNAQGLASSKEEPSMGEHATSKLEPTSLIGQLKSKKEKQKKKSAMPQGQVNVVDGVGKKRKRQAAEENESGNADEIKASPSKDDGGVAEGKSKKSRRKKGGD
ncbi:hypothetical protein BT69DRAFT_1345965 [Atractiella rhizophila]|nr:hypothetical protein BT69DRAFT_1345965 [Atractiella rhizophila]